MQWKTAVSVSLSSMPIQTNPKYWSLFQLSTPVQINSVLLSKRGLTNPSSTYTEEQIYLDGI